MVDIGCAPDGCRLGGVTSHDDNTSSRLALDCSELLQAQSEAFLTRAVSIDLTKVLLLRVLLCNIQQEDSREA